MFSRLKSSATPDGRAPRPLAPPAPPTSALSRASRRFTGRRSLPLAMGAAAAIVLAGCGSSAGIEDAALEAIQPTVGADTAIAAPAETTPPTVAEVIVPTSTPIPTLAPPTALPTATPTPIPPRTGNIEYTVVGGDVLGLIAERYDVTQREILDVNDGMSASVLSVGQVIVIPPPGGDTNEGADAGTDDDDETASETTATARPQATVAAIDTSKRNATDVHTHEIASGQFLGTVAAAFDVSVNDLVVYNGLSSADSVFIGQKILIPPVGTTVDGAAQGGTTATAEPTVAPTVDPNVTPTVAPTVDPNVTPTVAPTVDPNATATVAPTVDPNATATPVPTVDPNATATPVPTVTPTVDPNATPTVAPTVDASQTTPTLTPTPTPTVVGGETATAVPTVAETATAVPTAIPTPLPTSTEIPCNTVLFPSCSGAP